MRASKVGSIVSCTLYSDQPARLGLLDSKITVSHDDVLSS
jgi:hypothetical protein